MTSALRGGLSQKQMGVLIIVTERGGEKFPKILQMSFMDGPLVDPATPNKTYSFGIHRGCNNPPRALQMNMKIDLQAP